jgi:hypothetical protein
MPAMTNVARELVGMAPQGDPSVALKPAETRWLLVKNPRFGDIPSEPEFIWVEEDKVPTTMTTLIRGEKAIIAAPEVVARYGPPPGSGKISPRQGMPMPTETASAAPATARAASTPHRRRSRRRRTAVAAAATAATVRQGLVLYRRHEPHRGRSHGGRRHEAGHRAQLAARPHPDRASVTGEVLGDLDEEVATARITEVRERFSVAELQTVAPGAAVQIKDRVVAK